MNRKNSQIWSGYICLGRGASSRKELYSAEYHHASKFVLSQQLASSMKSLFSKKLCQTVFLTMNARACGTCANTMLRPVDTTIADKFGPCLDVKSF